MRPMLLALCATLLGACASTPPPPDWQASAFAARNHYVSTYLEGNTRVADWEFARAQNEVSRTGRPDRMARLELVRCATQAASLVLEPCNGYLALAADALPPEQAYAAFLSGQWAGLDAKLLPPAYQSLVQQPMPSAAHGTAATQGATSSTSATSANSVSGASGAAASSLLKPIEDPLSRLVAAAVLLQQGRIGPADVALAVDAASAQGWRRPLLAWLGVQFTRAHAAGDAAQAARVQRRIDTVLHTAVPAMGAPQDHR